VTAVRRDLINEYHQRSIPYAVSANVSEDWMVTMNVKERELEQTKS
jgi:hypothetical protein